MVLQLSKIIDEKKKTEKWKWAESLSPLRYGVLNEGICRGKGEKIEIEKGCVVADDLLSPFLRRPAWLFPI